MKRDGSFKDFVLDQLNGLPELRAKAMFGGFGLYSGQKFFAILLDGRIYFKTDDCSRRRYEERGMPPFIYEKARQTVTVRYYEVPPEILEDRSALLEWAAEAVRASEIASTRRTPRPR